MQRVTTHVLRPFSLFFIPNVFHFISPFHDFHFQTLILSLLLPLSFSLSLSLSLSLEFEIEDLRLKIPVNQGFEIDTTTDAGVFLFGRTTSVVYRREAVNKIE
ncbi:unnamed protein product [Trifolium pratense]|uniref:Uncharacterized protein n=1 Tax=Trifolium pratense TaxID=57577 RepID=A0ACB0IB15_TRIPR|nr:unnamed protein product [Trifolium pratense]